jgi:hypothetical protein
MVKYPCRSTLKLSWNHPLAESHLTRPLFGSVVGSKVALPLPTGQGPASATKQPDETSGTERCMRNRSE